MNRMSWVGPFVLKDYLGELLAMKGSVWPSSRPGVYVVASQLWTGQPAAGMVLYTGGTGNLRNRIADLVRDVLGFYGSVEDGPGWIGKHCGAQSAWEFCSKNNKQVGDLVIGWAVTSFPCHWCMEKELARQFKPSLNKRAGIKTCRCRPA